MHKKETLTRKDFHQVLGLSPGASEKEIKSAYRKLALKYHPDKNKAPAAARRFQEIREAHDFLLQHPAYGSEEARSYDDRVAEEVLRRERERMKQQARARREKKRKEEEYFNSPDWQDTFLVLKYTGRSLVLLFAVAAVILPLLLAVFGDPASLAGTAVFILMGLILLVYIWQQRKSWFRPGSLKVSVKQRLKDLKIRSRGSSKDRCCYCRSTMADGKSYRIELLRTLEIRTRSYGALDHEAGYRNKRKRVVVPRSVRAERFHRTASLIKVISIVFSMLLLPLDSLIWRFIAGMLAGGLLSGLLLHIVRVRSKVSYLFTPALLIKLTVWILALLMISTWGPGLNVRVSAYIYLLVGGLLFFLDMLFDLLLGFFPFYQTLFRPIGSQGQILNGLYKEGYRNYQELPVYSVLFPLFRWLF